MTATSESQNDSLEGKVAVFTGASRGLGAAAARRLAARGAKVIIADVEDTAGQAVAEECGGTFVHVDVREPEDSQAMIDVANATYGGVDIVHLNAGVSTGTAFGDAFDVAAYRRAMGINLDGVVYGMQAALPALRARGGGQIIVTASLAALTPVPFDPFYGANKAAVVHLVRSLAEQVAPENIRVNALCPSFAETAIITEIKPFLVDAGFPILSIDDVIDAFELIVDGYDAGQAWFVVPGRDSEPFGFRHAPGPRAVTEGGK